MIILRILSATRRNPSVGTLAPYRRVQRIIAESGILYLLSLIASVATLSLQCHANSLPKKPLWARIMWPYAGAFTYSQSILIPIAVSGYFL